MQKIEYHTYCGRCGSKNDRKEEYFFVCPRCDLHTYVNPKPTTAIILTNEEGEVLFVRRAFDPKKGYLDVPGGFIEPNESIEESARRELLEETGITVSALTQQTGIVENAYIYRENWFPVLSIFLTGEIKKDTKIVPADDVASYEWIKLQDVNIDDCAFESMKKYIIENR